MDKPLTTKQQAFLEAYRTYGIVRIAAAKSGVSPRAPLQRPPGLETYRQALAAIEKEHAAPARRTGPNHRPESGGPGTGLLRPQTRRLQTPVLRQAPDPPPRSEPPREVPPPQSPRKRHPPDNGTNFSPPRTTRTRPGPIEPPSPRRPSLEALLLEEEARTIAPPRASPNRSTTADRSSASARKYSDRLLICLLEANNPRKFRFPAPRPETGEEETWQWGDSLDATLPARPTTALPNPTTSASAADRPSAHGS